MGFELPENYLVAAAEAADERGYSEPWLALLEAWSARQTTGFEIDSFELTDQSSETAIFTHKDVYRHIEIPDEAAEGIATVGDAVKFIEEKKG